MAWRQANPKAHSTGAQANMEEDEGAGPVKSKKVAERPAKRARKSGAKVRQPTELGEVEKRRLGTFVLIDEH